MESVMRETKRAKRLKAIEKKSKPSEFAKHAFAKKIQLDHQTVAIHNPRLRYVKPKSRPEEVKQK